MLRYVFPLRRPSSVNAQRLERLVMATSALITEISLEGVLHRVVQVAAEVIDARYAAIGVVAPDGKVMESFTTYGIDPELRADQAKKNLTAESGHR